jgi:adenosylhomocysteine nucleosidase
MVPEFVPLKQRLDLQSEQRGDMKVHTGRIGHVEIMATITGIGMQPAREVTEKLFDVFEPDHVIVVGVAGGIAPHTSVGDLVVPAVVFDSETETERRAVPLGDATPAGTIRSSDDFLTDNEMLAALGERGVIALDMETAAVAAVCDRRGVPWTAFRSISDMATDDDSSDELLNLAKSDGTANVGGLIRFLAFKPWRVRQLTRLAKGARLATNAAADAAVDACARHRFDAAS